jgi:beta-1,2-mannobiose phosphorylase / 1,2-beta-oligomannan phosphorylase
MKASDLPVERCNEGDPIIAPTSNWWETGVTFNAAAFYLERSTENDLVIQALLPMRTLEDPELAEGLVAIHYRARPEVDPGSSFVRSFIGLALFTPDLKPLYRYQEPVLYPSPAPDGFDHYGVEDPRITRLDGAFYMVYCGVRPDPGASSYQAVLCLARSADLRYWEKLGPLRGDINRTSNKDGVLFPGRIGSKYYLLHRPYGVDMELSAYAIRLAESDSLEGEWRDNGEIMRSFPNPRFAYSWLGAGSVPMWMSAKKYALIYHTGNYHLNRLDREYDLDAALFDFERFDPSEPASIVTGRLEHLMTPETPAELRSHSTLQVGNVLFACGSYEYKGYIYIIYGGADTYTLAARIDKQVLFDALEQTDLTNPHSIE